MKKTIVVFSIASVLIMILAAFPSVIAGKTIQPKNEDSYLFSLLKEKTDFNDEEIGNIVSKAKWYPGFLIVQLVKGVLALIIVLLILFDIIEPEE